MVGLIFWISRVWMISIRGNEYGLRDRIWYSNRRNEHGVGDSRVWVSKRGNEYGVRNSGVWEREPGVRDSRLWDREHRVRVWDRDRGHEYGVRVWDRDRDRGLYDLLIKCINTILSETHTTFQNYQYTINYQ